MSRKKNNPYSKGENDLESTSGALCSLVCPRLYSTSFSFGLQSSPLALIALLNFSILFFFLSLIFIHFTLTLSTSLSSYFSSVCQLEKILERPGSIPRALGEIQRQVNVSRLARGLTPWPVSMYRFIYYEKLQSCMPPTMYQAQVSQSGWFA
jgi:hypothetical protein